ncbi:DNA repair protein RAD51 homolog 4-like [Coffea arabica]|uniref:DNA repair protein RAD51 homolog 4-like n=1 Tax=Coffea arabica TaxID=13443 RepID=A0A6P6UD87_COFAR|nr:DNA repair protein RAD51 homolog 4-like [Coffea arabica]XP_027087867.1 DNA repair protein RAD51 homolog 4-like [Coffea arabica]
MAPLKSLESEYPIIDSDFRQFCASHAIFSVEDFLVHDIYVLMALAEEHDTSDRLKQAITQVLSIIDAQHQPWLDGLELLGYSQKSKSILSTGCERIDAFLRGGFQGGVLTELVGPSSSGKTQVCLLAASNVTKSGLGRVLFLDTGNSFSPTRVAQFVSSSSELADTESSKILPQVLDNIECRSVFDIFTLLDVLHQLLQNLRYQVGQNLRMLIIDSVSSLITPVLGGAGTHGHALMASAGFLLKKLAYEHNLSVLMTNHMVAGDGGVIKPALGESWKSIPHIRLLLSRDVLNNICSMFILRHPSMAIGERVEFAIL